MADELRELTERLVAIDSVNPSLVEGAAGEAEIARFVASWLEEHGVAVEIDEVAPGRPNVVGRVRGSGTGRTLLLNGHLDTVGLGDSAAGLAPRFDAGRLYSRGAYDMKGSLAAMMVTAARAAADLRLAGDLVVTLVSDEEALSIGTERVAATVRADAAIVVEPTDLRLAVAHRGFVWLDVETYGRAAHGSRYDLGEDAIVRMGSILVGLERLDERLAERPPHPLLGRASVHASLIEGGTELSTYPDRCVVKVERRTLPGETVSAVEAELRALADGAAVASFFSRDPLETPPDATIVELVRGCALDFLGSAPEVVGVPFWTDAALLSAAGIPTVVFGPRGEGAHADVEWVELEDLERLAQILLAATAAFCA
ncbi:MAG TPA: M20/M25/M40 family metallo-hydrolase [Gaiellaceae bacterium]